jgi:cytochrome c oxidase assembly protein subunit 15
MVGGIFYEHSHRLIASCVGLLTIALAVMFWINEDRRWLRWLGIGALGMVILQGVLGGLRVVLLQHTLAIVHACFAQAFFALTVSLALFTTREWRSENATAIDDGGRLRRLALITTVLVYIQIVFGALLRHTGERLDGHLLFAALVAIHVVLLVLRVIRHHGAELTLVRPAYWMGGLLLVQLALGAAAYLGKFTTLLPLRGGVLVLTATTHLIIGALMLVTSLTIVLRAFRYSKPRWSRQSPTVLTEQFSL